MIRKAGLVKGRFAELRVAGCELKVKGLRVYCVFIQVYRSSGKGWNY